MITRDLHSAFFWDTASATKIATLDNPRVITAALNKDGKVCALEIDSENSGPEKVKFHDVLSGKTLRELKIKSDTRYRTGFSLEGFSTDDKTFVYVPLIDSAGKSEVQAWDTASGQLVSKFVLPARCKNFALSPDGEVMACAFFSGKPTVIYELASGKELVTLPKSIQADRFTLCAALRFSLDGKTLYAGTEDSLITFDVSTGKQLKELKLDCCPGSIAITQSGKVLVTGWTELISILDLGGKEIQTLNAPLYGFTNLGFSSDGKKIYGWGGDGRSGLRSWNLKDGHELACIEFPEKNAPKKSLDSIQCLFSSDFNTAVIPGDMSGSIVDLEHGRERLRLPHHTSSIAKIIPKPDGDSLLIVNEDGAVQTLYLKDGTLRSLATLDQKAIHVVPISDGDRVAVDCEDGQSYIIDSKSGQLTKLWRDSSDSMIACADGKTAYKSNQTKPFLTVKSLNDGTELAAPAAISDNEVKDIAVSKNGKTLVTANFSDIKVWKLGSNTLQWQYKKTDPDIWNVASSIAISPDDKLFAAASTDKTVKVWNLETGKLLYTLSGNKDVIGDLSFSPDSKKLATGTQDGRVAIYSTDDGRELKTASTDAGCITSLAFSHDGKLLVSGTKNGTLEFWNADSGRELCTMTPVDNASWVVFDGQGHFDGSAEGKELVHIFRDGLPLPAEETKKQGYKPNLFIERISGTEQVPLAR
jgi:WD40 repeat protein